MSKKEESIVEVVEVATQTERMFSKDGETIDLHGLLASIATDIKRIKEELTK